MVLYYNNVIYKARMKGTGKRNMSALEAVFFGIIQGLAEFLPISSSGHLAFFHNIFENMADLEADSAFTFDILLHLGTLLAVFIVYYKDIWELILAFFSLIKKIFREKFNFKSIKLSENEKFLIMLFIAILPLVIGAAIEDLVGAVRNYTIAIGVLWLLNGAMLFFSDKVAAARMKQAPGSTEKSKTFLNALKVGFWQLIAIFPGISRSGMTITGGLLCGFDREYAVKFSFILSVPAILGANILSLTELSSHPVASADIFPYICGMLAALLSGLCAIKLLGYISKKKNFRIFAYYSFVIGIVAIVIGLFKH